MGSRDLAVEVKDPIIQGESLAGDGENGLRTSNVNKSRRENILDGADGKASFLFRL